MTGTIADLIEDRFGLETAAGAEMPADGELASILTHRTHRRFRDDPVADDLLEVLLAAAFSAPAKSDLQQACVILVENAAKRAAIAGLIPDMPWIGRAPRFLVFCGDGRRIRRICDMRGVAFANDHLDGFMNPAADAAMVLQNFIRAAAAVGLGCCPISVIRNHVETVAPLLALPQGVFPFAGLCLGYPSQAGYVSLRLPPAVTVHKDAYDDSDLEAEIDAYDRRRDARYSIPPEKQRYREDFGEADFYGWSEDKARQVSRPERAGFGAFIRKRGFSLS